MRLFVAIDLDDDARAAVVTLQRDLAKALGRLKSDLRWTRPEQLHLTLAFIGEVDDAALRRISGALGPAVDVPAYTLVLGGLGMFPPGGAPRILWLGSVRGARETIEVQRIVAERLAGVGVSLEPRPFHAHLTLGRWREAGPRDRRAVLEVADTGEVARSTVRGVTLYHSRLSPQGAAYAPLVRTPLGEG